MSKVKPLKKKTMTLDCPDLKLLRHNAYQALRTVREEKLK